MLYIYTLLYQTGREEPKARDNGIVKPPYQLLYGLEGGAEGASNMGSEQML